MNKNTDSTSEGLNQIFEIINAKGDIGEINDILDKNQIDHEKKEAIPKEDQY